MEKIKLLRRLGISVEEPRQLRNGEEALSVVLDRRLTVLGGAGWNPARFDRIDRRGGLPRERMMVATMAFFWAREGAPFWPSQKEEERQVLYNGFDKQDRAGDFFLRQGDAVATLEIEAEDVAGYASPADRIEENCFAFTMALEEQGGRGPRFFRTGAGGKCEKDKNHGAAIFWLPLSARTACNCKGES